MKKRRNNAKMALCLVLSAAILFTNMEIAVSAEESAQADEVQKELEAEESFGMEETDEVYANEEEQEETEETQSAGRELTEADSKAESFEMDTEKADTDFENMEEDLVESSSAEESSSTEESSEGQTETGESEPKLSFSDTDIAHGEYKENGNDIVWVIDENGKLTVEGMGDFADPSNNRFDRAPWYDKQGKIKKAEIKVKGMTNASYMLYSCGNMTDVDLSGFDTSQVTDMGDMFAACSSMTDVDLSGFDTSQVTDMGDMFAACSSMTDVDLSGFDTSQVTNMGCMFSSCYSLTKVNLSSFNASQVTNMNSMFYFCDNLTEVDLSSFGTSQAADMSRMFYGCDNLTEVDLSNFGTGQAADMSYMFANCPRLTKVNLSSFNASQVTNISGMFLDCHSLTKVDLSDFNTSQVTDMSDMFYYCESMTDIDLSGFNTSQVTDMSGMFLHCESMMDVDLSGFNTSQVTDMHSMFGGCYSLTDLDLSSFDTSQVTDMCSMFSSCSNLTDVDLSSFNTSRVTDMHYMFNGCDELTKLDLSSFDMSHIWHNDDIEYMLGVSDNLRSINTPYNVDIEIELPNIFYDATGNKYEILPQGLGYSILLTRDQPSIKTAYITAAKTKTVYEIGDIINTNDLTVMYYDTAGTAKQLEAGEYTTNAETIDTSKAGNQILTITYNGLIADVPLKILQKEGGETEESSMVEESSATEESSTVEESSAAEESSTVEESSAAEESSTVEESSATEESSDMDDSPHPDDERTDLSSIAAVATIKDKIYDGEAYEPVLKITASVGGKKTVLTEGADYRVLYEQGEKSAAAGEHTVTVRGNGEYKGQIVKTFTIKPKSIKKLKIITGGIVGTSDLNTLPLCVYDGAKRLQLGTDYTLLDYRTTKPTAADVIVKGEGNYEGTVKAKFTIYESGTQLITPECVALQDDAAIYAYTGKAVKPKVTVTVNGTTLTDKDYKVQYQNNKNAGTAYVTVTGKGDYKGKAVLPFTIRTETVETPDDFSIEEIKAKTYNGKLQKPTVSVNIRKNGKTKKLSKKDYKVTYKDNFHAGEATIIVTGKGNYAGLSATVKFTIEPQQIKKASLKGTQGALVLTYNKRKLREGIDYEKPEYGAAAKNKAAVTIKGKGDFTGEMTKNVKVQ